MPAGPNNLVASTTDAQEVARALWELSCSRRKAIGQEMGLALRDHVAAIDANVAVDKLAALVGLCAPGGFHDAISAHASMVVDSEMGRRAKIVDALQALGAPTEEPNVLGPSVPTLVSKLALPLSVLRSELAEAIAPVRELQEFARSPDTSRFGRRMGVRAIGQLGHPLLGLAAGVVMGLVAKHTRGQKMLKFATTIASNAKQVAGTWQTLTTEHDEQARQVTDLLFFRSLEPHLLVALGRGARVKKVVGALS